MKPHAFLFDRNFPLRIARMVEQYWQDHLARHQDDDDRFEITTPDVEIIATLDGDPDHQWSLISADKRITRRPAERAALAGAGIKFFYFGKAWHRKDIHEQAWLFVRMWPTLVETALHHRAKVFEIEGANLKIVSVE
jgi:hypothetical protein